jgi:hypothetical protein
MGHLLQMKMYSGALLRSCLDGLKVEALWKDKMWHQNQEQ